ncbi:Cartilage intermediate layer protein 2 [Fukomys damarensis]|uniref:Cartilage intermediate layer protein 2 n=1 Tax=Fukomys damarensis TaxID=885580 RepID=A0A091CVL4_FUKDA|nr:Cartilage intermediate layer protein 2 [Fukomys damarensis]
MFGLRLTGGPPCAHPSPPSVPSTAEAAALERELLEDYRFGRQQLVELCGHASAVAVTKVFPLPTLSRKQRTVLVVCGPEHNGAVGLVCARHLRVFEYEPTIFYPTRSLDLLHRDLTTQCEKMDIPFLSYLPAEMLRSPHQLPGACRDARCSPDSLRRPWRPGKVGCSPDTCECPDHILLGSVVTSLGRPLSGARVSLKTQPGTVTTSDARGTFRVPGICASSRVNVSAQLDGFSLGLAQARDNGSSSSVVTIVLDKLRKPYLVKHPESRVREAGQNVTFCCKAAGTPTPKKYSWFHNGTLLDRRQHGSGAHLELRGLRMEQAGSYHCKAWSEAGTVRSSPAQLTVLAPGQPACDPQPQEHLIRLPEDCSRPGSSGPAYLDVGLCPDSRCLGPVGSMARCGDIGSRCCAVRRLESQEIRCAGYVLPVKVVAECGCQKCLPPRGLVRGHLVAADSREPLSFARILLGPEPIGFTSYQGDFTLEVPPSTERLVVTFIDPRGKFVDTVRVLPFDPRGTGVYHEVQAMRKQPAILLDSSQSNVIPLGDLQGEAPIGELVLPPGSIRSADGSPYVGTVEARVTFVDPRDLASAVAAPSDLRFAHGPVYPWRSLRECLDAPVTASHFRFSRVESDKYEYNVVPFREGAPASWTGHLLSWWPNPQEFRACYLKVKVQGPQEVVVRSHNAGGSHPHTQGQLYGLRDARSSSLQAVFLLRTRLFSLEEELGTSLSLAMAAAFIRGALTLTTSITSWLRCGPLSLVAQILHLTSVDFLASTAGLGAFRRQILRTEEPETLPWAPGLWLDSRRTLPRTRSLQLDLCGDLLDPGPQSNALGF